MILLLFAVLAAQFMPSERNFLVLEYHKKRDRGRQGFFDEILVDFQQKFPTSRIPSKRAIIKMHKKQMEKGTVPNTNSKSSPGASHSGRRKTARSPQNVAAVKNVMDRDSAKVLGDPTVSPVSSARRNALGIDKSSWSRIKSELK